MLDALVQFTERCSEVTCAHLTSHALLSRAHIPDSFVRQVITCAQFFVASQLRAITRNLALYGRCTPALNRQILADRHVVAQEWWHRYAPAPLPRDLRLSAAHVTAPCREENCAGNWSRGAVCEPESDTCHTGAWLSHVRDYYAPVHAVLEHHWPLLLHVLACHSATAVAALLARDTEAWGAPVLGTVAELHHTKLLDDALLTRKLSVRAALSVTRVKQALAALPSPYAHSYCSVDGEKVAELLAGPLHAWRSYPGHVLDLSRGRGGTAQALLAHTTMTRVTTVQNMPHVDSPLVHCLDCDSAWSDTVTGVNQVLARVRGAQCQLVLGNLSNRWHKQRHGVQHVLEYHAAHQSPHEYTRALESITWSQLSAEVCVALTCLTAGGTLVLQAWDVLLRPGQLSRQHCPGLIAVLFLGAGLLHVLSRVFKHVHVIKLAHSSPVTCE